MRTLFRVEAGVKTDRAVMNTSTSRNKQHAQHFEAIGSQPEDQMSISWGNQAP